MPMFRGRMGRHDFARYALLAWVALNGIAVAGAVPMHAIDGTYPLDHVPSGLREIVLPEAVSIALVAIGSVAMIAIVYLLLAVNVKRFHDLGLSGWFVLLWLAITALVPRIELGDYLPSVNDLLWYAVLVTLPGTKGINRFGPPEAGDDRSAPQTG